MRRFLRIATCILGLVSGYLVGMLLPRSPAADVEARDEARLVVTAAPRFSVASATKPVLVMARIQGEEVEEFYCPARELWWNGERVSRSESDCPPFAEREEYPRTWIFYLERISGQHVGQVRLFRAGREVARGEAHWEVR